MVPEQPSRRSVTLILPGLGVFQVMAAGAAAFFWILAGEWQRFMPAIVSIGLLAWPVSYLVWRKFEVRFR